MTRPWTEKHRPEKVSGIVGNRDAVEEFVSWMHEWETGRPAKRAALLHGPAGVGKTSLVLAYAKEHGLDVVEVNASDTRSAEKVEWILGAASRQATLAGPQRRIILVDEVDGITGREDAGGVSALSKIISQTRVPIAMVANDPWDQRLATLREKAHSIEFRRIPRPSVVSHLKKILAAEGGSCADEVLREIAARSGGDLRSAINDLQALVEGGGMAGEGLNALAERNRSKQVFAALASVFDAKTLDSGRRALEGLDMDMQSVYQWIFDNASEQLTDPDDLELALERLARADLHLQRAAGWQRWGLLRYAEPLMTAGVGLAKSKTPPRFARFSFPSKIRFMGSTKGKRELMLRVARKVALKCHLSTRKAVREVVPYLSFMLSQDRQKGEGLVTFFEFDDEEVEYLSGPRAARNVGRKAGSRHSNT